MSKNFEKMIRKNFWAKGKPKIALAMLQLPEDQGGLHLVNLRLKQNPLKAK